MVKRALILGVTGMDGSHLADILLEKGYDVNGMYRRSTGNLKNIQHLIGKITLHRGDMCDPLSVARIIEACNPDEIFNEADQDNVNVSYRVPAYNADITYKAVVNLLEILKARGERGGNAVKLFQPCSAMMFGMNPHSPQDENSTFHPQSPYAVAKVAAYYICQHYRREHNMFVSTGILYNHDSPRRSEDYLLNKICRSAVRISLGKQDKLVLGCLDMKVDIGCAREYMEAAWAMLQLDMPRDFVIGSGKCHSIRELAYWAFECVGISWPEEADDLITVDPKFARPGPQPTLQGDIHRAQAYLNFNPSPVRVLIQTIITSYKQELGVL